MLQTTSDLVNMLKLEADELGDDEHRKKLLAAAKLLADATAKMVEAAKVGSVIGILVIVVVIQ